MKGHNEKHPFAYRAATRYRVLFVTQTVMIILHSFRLESKPCTEKTFMWGAGKTYPVLFVMVLWPSMAVGNGISLMRTAKGWRLLSGVWNALPAQRSIMNCRIASFPISSIQLLLLKPCWVMMITRKRPSRANLLPCTASSAGFHCSVFTSKASWTHWSCSGKMTLKFKMSWLPFCR